MNAASRAARNVRRTFRNALRHWIVLAAGLFLLLAGSAAAEDDDPFDRPGFYVGLGGLFATNVFEGPIEDYIDDEIDTVNVGGNTIQVSNFALDIDDSGGLDALVGYRAASFFAVELQYEWIDEYDVAAKGTGTVIAGPLTGQSLSLQGDLYSIEGHTLTLNTKWIIPFWRIQPYLTIGGGLSVYETNRGSAAPVIEALTNGDVEIDGGDHTALAGRFGGGLDLYLTEHILLNTYGGVLLTTQDFHTPNGDNADDLNYVGFSAQLQYRF